MNFATTEARANASVLGRLVNATATIALPADVAGTTMDGIFDNGDLSVVVGPGIDSSGPQFAINEADLQSAVADALVAGDPVQLCIRGVDYAVVEAHPDGVGWTVLRLRK